MQRFSVLLICLFFLSNPLFSQKKELKTKFGKLSDKEITMTSYEADPAAPAVVLFDKGDLSHRYDNNNGFVISFERSTRVKIFKKEVLDIANIIVPHHREIKVGEIKASSFNMENGKMVETKLEKTSIFEEEITQNYSLTKFVIPNVKEGTIIEYTYTLSSNHYIPFASWRFQQNRIPTIWSEFQASIPAHIEFKKMSQGWVPFSLAEENQDNESLIISIKSRSVDHVATTKYENVNVEYQVNKMHFIQETIPALKAEDFVNSPNDYLSSIDLDIRAVYDIDFIPSGTFYRMVNGLPTNYLTTWANLGKDLLTDVYGKDLDSKKNTEDIAKSLTSGKTSIAEKVAAIYEYIGTNYTVKDDYDRIFKSQTLDVLVKDRKGTPTDLNLLLVNMVRRAGIAAWPVIISTTDHGRVKTYSVSTDEFNRVIAGVQMEDSTLLLVDAAAFPNPIGLLDIKDLGAEGLLLQAEDLIKWVPIQNKISLKTAVIGNLNLQPDGMLGGSIICYENGYMGVSDREVIKEKGEMLAIKEKFKEWFTDGELSDLKITNATNWNEASVKHEFNFNSNSFTTTAGEKIYYKPLMGLGVHENPFKNPERKFNVDLGPVLESSYNISVKIPTGFKIEEMPKPTKMTFGENALSFEYVTEIKGDLMKFNIRMKQKTDFVSSTEYADLKQFFGLMASKMEEQVVLSKN